MIVQEKTIQCSHESGIHGRFHKETCNPPVKFSYFGQMGGGGWGLGGVVLRIGELSSKVRQCQILNLCCC